MCPKNMCLAQHYSTGEVLGSQHPTSPVDGAACCSLTLQNPTPNTSKERYLPLIYILRQKGFINKTVSSDLNSINRT